MEKYIRKCTAVYKGSTYIAFQEVGGSKKEKDNITLVSKKPIDEEKWMLISGSYQLELELSELDEWYLPDFKVLIGGEYYDVMSANRKTNILSIPTIKSDKNEVFSYCEKGPFGYPDEMMVYVPDKYAEAVQLKKYIVEGRSMHVKETLESDLDTLYNLIELGVQLY